MATINVSNPSDDLKMVAVLQGFDPAECKFTLSTAERIQSTNIFDVLSGAAQQVEETVDEVIDRRIKATFAAVTIKCGKHKPVRVDLDHVPPEVVAEIRVCEEQAAADKARFNALSKSEQQAEVRGLLDQLRGTPGFMAFGVTTDDDGED